MFMRDEYLQEVVDSMCRGHGFEFLSKVVMSTDMCKYHLHAFAEAKHTRLFFCAPKKSLVVMLEFVEHCGSVDWDFEKECALSVDTNFYECQWRANVWLAYDFLKWYEKEILQSRNMMTDHTNPVVSWLYSPSMFTCTSTSSDGNTIEVQLAQAPRTDKTQALEPAQVTEKFGLLLKELGSSLYRRFRTLQVTNFPPAFVFPGCEALFWKMFVVERLKNIASRIYGGKFEEKEATN